GHPLWGDGDGGGDGWGSAAGRAVIEGNLIDVGVTGRPLPVVGANIPVAGAGVPDFADGGVSEDELDDAIGGVVVEGGVEGADGGGGARESGEPAGALNAAAIIDECVGSSGERSNAAEVELSAAGGDGEVVARAGKNQAIAGEGSR